MSQTSKSHFADRLVGRLRALGHPLCVGLDPHLDHIPRPFRRGAMEPAAPETAAAVEEFSCEVIDRLHGRVAVVKPQIAFFEQLGWRGLKSLEALAERVRALDIMLLLDAKRGDIGSTADGYARAYLEPGSPIVADAITLNPYLGLDTLEPFAARAERHDRGLFVLVKTSNPGSGDLQDLTVARGARVSTTGPLFTAVASSLSKLSDRLAGPATGWSSLGVVVGATWPEQAIAVRERLPNALFLVPGYGAQGGSASEAMSGFVRGPSGLEGGVVSSSRAILFPQGRQGAESSSAREWERGVEEALARACDELGEAVSRGR